MLTSILCSDDVLDWQCRRPYGLAQYLNVLGRIAVGALAITAFGSDRCGELIFSKRRQCHYNSGQGVGISSWATDERRHSGNERLGPAIHAVGPDANPRYGGNGGIGSSRGIRQKWYTQQAAILLVNLLRQIRKSRTERVDKRSSVGLPF